MFRFLLKNEMHPAYLLLFPFAVELAVRISPRYIYLLSNRNWLWHLLQLILHNLLCDHVFLRWYHCWYHLFARLLRLTIAGGRFGTNLPFPCHHGLSWLSPYSLIGNQSASGFSPQQHLLSTQRLRHRFRLPILEWLDSNQRMRESESLALPLGYTPMLIQFNVSPVSSINHD